MTVNTVLASAQAAVPEVLHRRVFKHRAASDLADIYRPEVNGVIWPRRLSEEVQRECRAMLGEPRFSGGSVTLPARSSGALVDMFATLFEVERVGLRLLPLEGQMCPRFHVDRVPCRMVTTYAGAGTQWLPQHRVDRSKLGPGSGGLKDSESGLFADTSHIESMAEGDVALLKGEMWEGNEGGGLVHRSPLVPGPARRLLLTLDMG